MFLAEMRFCDIRRVQGNIRDGLKNYVKKYSFGRLKWNEKMKERPKWQYDEMKHCGVDYSEQGQVEVYDKRHQKFRDYEKEGQAIIDQLELGADDTVIDIGCGTGAFALYAAKKC